MKKIMFKDKYGLTDAVLEGRKTMTRRLIKGDFGDIKVYHANGDWHFIADTKDGDSAEVKPSYNVGEELAIAQAYGSFLEIYPKPQGKFDGYRNNMRWDNHLCMFAQNSPGYKNKMFVRADLMPRRIKITNIRLERLQNISDEDCLREGVEPWLDHSYIVTGIMERGGKGNKCFDSPREAFAALIDKVSGKGTWNSSPWVFAYEFELI